MIQSTRTHRVNITQDFFASLRRNSNAVQKLEKPKHLKENSAEALANLHLVRAIAWNASLEDLRKPVSNINMDQFDFSQITQ